MQKKTLLAFDCSCAGASITLAVEGISVTRTLAQGKQAAALIPAIDLLMKESQIAYKDLTMIISTIGPGSFTGLRIGLAALHGLVLVHHTPVKLLTTLEAMAWNVFSRPDTPQHITTVMRAGKGELAAQEFAWVNGRPQAMGEIYLVAESHTDWSSPAYGNHLPIASANYLPDADTETLCRVEPHLAESRLAEALPLYIRPPDALIPKAHAWLAS